jgi:hypothetical protein
MIRTVGIGLAVLLAAASGSVNAQQTNRSDFEFMRQRATGTPSAKTYVKARPKTSKCKGFDCSELTQWATSGTGQKGQTKNHFVGRGLDIARIDGQPVAKPKSRVVSGEVFVKLPGASTKVARTRALSGVRPPRSKQ